jgi:hypothetical protein
MNKVESTVKENGKKRIKKLIASTFFVFKGVLAESAPSENTTPLQTNRSCHAGSRRDFFCFGKRPKDKNCDGKPSVFFHVRCRRCLNSKTKQIVKNARRVERP